MGNQVDREKMYEKLRKLDKKVKAQPKTLKSENGTFILDPKDKHQKEWFENDEDFGGYGDKNE
jgi:hypothetical protein